MYCVSVEPSFGLRGVVCAVLSALVLVSVTADPADARARRSKWKPATADQRYADIVVDVNSGDVLRGTHPDAQRFPASLTKIMTLYLLFEQIETGKLKLSNRLEVSPEAATQAPSKLGLTPGGTISVEDSIRALVTKSANDAAVVVAEAIAGTEEDFAKLMTRKARALGMSRTTYKNASGLPDDEQLTTARDQALLAMAIQDRFPKHYSYFSTASFRWNGRTMRNHNRLLGRVEGVDGIKTGYTRASGFNLVTSVRRGKRHIVAVVLGGKSGGARDARMRELIAGNIMQAAINRTSPKVAAAPDPAVQTKRVRVAAAVPAAPLPDPAPSKADTSATAAIPTPRPAAGSTEPIKPHVVKTLSVKPSTAPVAAAAPLSLTPAAAAPAHTTLAVRTVDASPPPPAASRPGVLGVLSMPVPQAAPAAAETPRPQQTYAVAGAPAAVPLSPPPAAPAVRAKPRSGWIIQVGAFEAESEARERLSSAQEKAAKLLAGSEPFTEPVSKGDKTLYRARFAGLKPDQAEAACRILKRSDIACMALRN